MLKLALIDAADAVSRFAKRKAQRWLKRSIWWADLAERIETGDVESADGSDQR